MKPTYHRIYKDHPWIEDEEENIIKIPLTNKRGETIDYAISDLDKKDLVLQYSYHRYKNTYKDKDSYYAKSNMKIRLHEIVMGEKAADGWVIDHKNNNGLDNRRNNLQYATYCLNAQNRVKKESASSQYIGVSKEGNKWRVQLNYHYQKMRLGAFDNEIEAGRMYDMYVIFLYRDEGYPKTNELLTDDEIDEIIYNGIPEQYKLKEKPARELPKYIYLNPYGSYLFSINRLDAYCCKTFKTLQEAIDFKENFLNELILNKKEPPPKEITRNDNGQAIVKMPCGLATIVDDHVWHDITRFSWNACINKYGKFSSYPSAHVKGRRISLHRYLFEKYKEPIPRNMTIDHVIPGNILDNRLDNLRLASKSLQSHNRDRYTDSFDIYRGIEFRGSSYRVRINGQYYGKYETAEEAAEQANKIFEMLYGDDAYLNKIDYTKRTTKDNRIPEELINEEFIKKLTKMEDLRNVVYIKGFFGNYHVSRRRFKSADIEEYKQTLINLLYYPERIVDPHDITEDMITKEFIMNIKQIIDLETIIKIKKLNVGAGGDISMKKIDSDTFNEYKTLVLQKLYPEDFPIEQVLDRNKFLERAITKETIAKIENVNDLRKVVQLKKLSLKYGGSILAENIKTDTLEEIKLEVLQTLYPEDFPLTMKARQNIPDVITEDIIDKQLIIDMKMVKHLKEIVRIKKLGINEGGNISIKNITPGNFESVKQLILQTLYPKDFPPTEIIVEDEYAIKESDITKEFIVELKRVKSLKAVVRTKKLYTKYGGPIVIDDIKKSNFEETKQLILKTLYQEELPDPSSNINDQTDGDIITKEYIINLTTARALREVVKNKKLSTGCGGKIVIGNIVKSNLEATKQLVLQTLYPEDFQPVSNANANTNIITENMINKEFIMNINTAKSIKEVVRIKNLGINQGGFIKLGSISTNNIEDTKKLILETLYPEDYPPKPTNKQIRFIPVIVNKSS